MTCTYTFKDSQGNTVTLTGQPQMKAYLVDGGMEALGYKPEGGFPWEANSGKSIDKPADAAMPVVQENDGINDDILFSKDIPEKDLAIIHNLSLDNLIHADEVGGLPAPSVAVVNKAFPMENFGEISLIADKDILGPGASAKNRFFNADIYSPRYPSIDYTVDDKAYDKFISGLSEKTKRLADQFSGKVVSAGDIEDKGVVKAFEYSIPMKYEYLLQQGKAPAFTYREKTKIPKQLQKYINKVGENAFLQREPDFIKDAVDAYNQQIDETNAEEKDKDFIESLKIKDVNSSQARNTAYFMAGEVKKAYKEKTTGRAIDTRALEDKISAKIDSTKYKEWVRENFSDLVKKERIFDGFAPSGKRKYLDHNLDNVVKILTRTVRGGEGFNYGVPSIRAHVAKQFKTVKSLQDAKESLVTKDAMDALKKEVNAEFDVISEKLSPYAKYSVNEASEALSGLASKGYREFKEYYEDVPSDVMQDVTDFLNKLKNMPSEYFGGKIGRAVKLGEFSAALVPKGKEYDSAVAILKRNGITNIQRYSEKDGRNKELSSLDDLLFKQTTTTKGSTVAEVMGWLNPRMKKLADKGKLKIVQSIMDVPHDAVRSALKHTAWHGSPHDHDGFDMSKIGTGEGAQAFGFGHYFTDEKKIAEFYRDSINKAVSFVNSTLFDSIPSKLQNEVFQALKSDIQILRVQRVDALKDKLGEYYDIVKSAALNEGKLYQVELAPTQDEYLDWDKPLSEQSEVVKNILGIKDNKKLARYYQLRKEKYKDGGRIASKDWTKKQQEELDSLFSEYQSSNDVAGKQFYEEMANKLGSDKAASDSLHSLGIRGIRYKAEQGKSDANNYVIFSDEDISITNKFSKMGGVQGYYNKKDDMIVLIADRISSQAVLRSVLQHEAYHRAETSDPKLKEQLARLDKQLSERFKLASEGKASPIENNAYKRVMAAKTPVKNQMDEFKAYLVTLYNNNPDNFQGTILQWIKDLYHAIRAALIRQGLLPRDITAADLNALAAYGYRDGKVGGKFNSPNILASFAGENAETADQYQLSNAKQLIESGADPEQVRQDTGWFKSADGFWRFEIDDSDASLKKPFPGKGQLWGDVYKSAFSMNSKNGKLGVTVGDMIDHPALFAAYPDIANISVTSQSKAGASYERKSSINPETIAINENAAMSTVLSDLLHEIQHGIQAKEGFASGGNEKTAMTANLSDSQKLSVALNTVNKIAAKHKYNLTEKQKQAIAKQVALWEHASDSEVKKVQTDAGLTEEEISNFFNQDFYEIYRRLAGEVEARNTQARQKMTAQQRKATPPSATQDVADSDVIIMFNGKEMQNAPMPENAKERLAPNGKPSNLNPVQYEQVRTPEFIKFFGDWINDPENASKVVDSNGEPLPVFHGSDAEFNTFKKPEINRMAQRSDVGFWFTTGRQETKRYGKGVKEVFLNIRNPKSITTRKLDMMAVSEPIAKVIPKLKRGKVDGLSIPEIKEDKMMGEKYTPAEYVVFNANQIKSATENTGDFNPENDDIRFSIADDLADAVSQAFTPRQGKQPLGWLAGLFQRNHLIDFVAKELPMLATYKSLSQQKDNVINQAEQEIAVSYQEMKDSMTAKQMSELGRVQGMATRLDDFDPAEFTGDVRSLSDEEKEVFDAYKALPAKAKEAYVKMREDYKKDLIAKKQALIDRINEFPADRETKGEIIKQIEAHFDMHLNKGVYFPLSRNGDIVITGKKYDENGDEIPNERVVSFVENGKDKDRLIADMKAQGYKSIKVTMKDAYIKSISERNAANNIAALATKAIADLRSMPREDGESSARDIIEGGDFDALLNNFNQLLIDALPDSSYRKHFIHRKGTLGYSTDTLRAYAGTRTSAAKNIAGLRFNHKITAQLDEADKAIKDMDDGEDSVTDTGALKSVMNELRKREEALSNMAISPAAQVLTSLGFMGALGFNVASAAVNMMQVPGVTLPELSGKHGFKDAALALNRAYGLLMNRNVLDKQAGFDLLKNPVMNKPENRHLKEALQRLNDIGKIDLTMTHDAIAMGQNPSYSDNAITRAAGGIAKYSGYLFHVAEALNRQVTGIAAFNLAFKKNGGDFEKAFEEAVDVIDRTQFDYSQGNRARYMMGNTARVLTLFKSYALGISYYMGRNVHNAIKGESPEIRLAARKAITAQMAMTFATSGLFGLPIGAEAFAILGGVAGFKYKGANFAVPGAIGGMLVFQALLAGLGADDEDDVETEFRNWLTDNFDQTTAEWVTKGPARLLPLGDISGRTSLADIWWRPQNKELEGRDQYQAIANALLGPLGSQVAGLFTAKQMYADGEYSRMVESLSPAFLRNAVAAARLGDEGAKNIKGDPIIDRDLTTVELINKVLGFNPSVLTNSYDANAAITKARDRINMRKAHLVNRYIDGDAETRAELLNGAIKDFNDEVEPQERITRKMLVTSIRHRKALDRRTENGLYLSRKQTYLRRVGRFGDEEENTDDE